MFGGGSSSEYEDIVNKATDENLTSENWELILNLCDKVQDEGQAGAHAAIASILKRLAHRNPNVQLYALSLAESLSKNLGIEIHRELASKAFTQGLEKLITDRNTHEKVRKRALGLIALWTMEFENDTTLGIMEECYDNLKSKNYKFEQPQEAPPPTVDDEIRRKEEEELQRVLEMSMQDKGGRNQWSEYSLASGSSSGGVASSSSAAGKSSAAAASASSSSPSASGSSSSHPFSQPKYQGGGYVPARTPSPTAVAAQQRKQQEQYHKAQAAAAAAPPQQQQHQSTSHHRHHAPSVSSSISDVSTPTVTIAPAPDPTHTPAAMSANGNIVTRVRALHTFEPTEPGELAFEKGDIIKVVDRGYKDWWRGQLKGRTGIFPVNYVESMPEPTAAELAKEAEQEAAVFSQAVNVEKLLNMLRALDPAKDNLADNEEIQELYRSSMALRPKIVKLIDKYSQKRADLVSMNETFVRARTIFDRMMEESLARHSGVYEQQPTFRPSQFAQARPDSRGGGRRPEYGPGPGPNSQPYGWGPPNAQPTGYGAYPPQQPNAYGGPIPGQPGPDGHSPYGNPNPTPAPGLGGPQGIPPQQQGIPPQQGYIDPNAAASGYGSPQGQPPQQIPGGYGVVPQGGYAGVQPNVPYTQQGPTPYPAQQQQQQQPPVQPQPQPVQQQQPLQQPIQPLQAQAQQPQPTQQQPVVVQQPQPIQQQPIQQQPIQPLQTQPQPIQQQPQPIQQQPVQQEYPQHHELQPIQTQLQTEPIQATSPARNADSASPQPVLHAQIQPQPQVQSQVQVQSEPQPQPQVQSQPQQPISGPLPYVYDASYTYADPNVQAWAQYYAQGGRDLAGSVYFISIPGVTDGAGAAPAAQPQQEVHGGQHQNLQRQQSLQAQQQPVQQQQQHPIESEVAYASGLMNNGGRATSPVQHQQHQQLQGVTRYQLSDQAPSSTAQSQQPQYANQYHQPGELFSGQQQSSPSGSTSSFGARPGTAGSYHSPTQTVSTPSWVLPKKGTASGLA